MKEFESVEEMNTDCVRLFVEQWRNLRAMHAAGDSRSSERDVQITAYDSLYVAQQLNVKIETVITDPGELVATRQYSKTYQDLFA